MTVPQNGMMRPQYDSTEIWHKSPVRGPFQVFFILSPGDTALLKHEGIDVLSASFPALVVLVLVLSSALQTLCKSFITRLNVLSR